MGLVNITYKQAVALRALLI